MSISGHRDDRRRAAPARWTSSVTIASGVVLTISAAAANTLKIEGSATSAAAISLNNANQTLLIGASGSLTISAAQTATNGTIGLRRRDADRMPPVSR